MTHSHAHLYVCFTCTLQFLNTCSTSYLLDFLCTTNLMITPNTTAADVINDPLMRLVPVLVGLAERCANVGVPPTYKCADGQVLDLAAVLRLVPSGGNVTMNVTMGGGSSEGGSGGGGMGSAPLALIISDLYGGSEGARSGVARTALPPPPVSTTAGPSTAPQQAWEQPVTPPAAAGPTPSGGGGATGIKIQQEGDSVGSYAANKGIIASLFALIAVLL